jgi:hypothetical protein
MYVYDLHIMMGIILLYVLEYLQVQATRYLPPVSEASVDL